MNDRHESLTREELTVFRDLVSFHASESGKNLLLDKIEKRLAQLERDALPITDHAAIMDLGFFPEADLSSPLNAVYSIFIRRHVNAMALRTVYRWGELCEFNSKRGVFCLYVYETNEDAYLDLEGSEDTLKTAVEDIRTIGELRIALDVATHFGRIEISIERQLLDEDESDDETPLETEESDLSGTLKADDHDRVVDVDDVLPF